MAGDRGRGGLRARADEDQVEGSLGRAALLDLRRDRLVVLGPQRSCASTVPPRVPVGQLISPRPKISPSDGPSPLARPPVNANGSTRPRDRADRNATPSVRDRRGYSWSRFRWAQTDRARGITKGTEKISPRGCGIRGWTRPFRRHYIRCRPVWRSGQYRARRKKRDKFGKTYMVSCRARYSISSIPGIPRPSTLLCILH